MDVQVLSEKRVKFCNAKLNKLITFENKLEVTVVVGLGVPAFGYTVVSCDQLENVYLPEHKTYGFEEFHYPKRLYGSMMTNYNQADNGKLIVTVNETGTVDVCDKKTGKIYKDILIFEDCGDFGDGWNYVKPFYDSRQHTGSVKGRMANNNPAIGIMGIVDIFLIGFVFSHGKSPFFDYGKGRQHSLLFSKAIAFIMIARNKISKSDIGTAQNTAFFS